MRMIGVVSSLRVVEALMTGITADEEPGASIEVMTTASGCVVEPTLSLCSFVEPPANSTDVVAAFIAARAVLYFIANRCVCGCAEAI